MRTSRNHFRLALTFAFVSLLGLNSSRSWAASSTIRLVSQRDPSLVQPVSGNSDSFSPVYSPDGNHLIFASAANNLTGDEKAPLRIDLYDRSGPQKTITLLTTTRGGQRGSPSISQPIGVAGNTLIYLSTAPDLVPSVTNGTQQLYAQDLTSGARRLLSHNSTNGTPANQSVSYAVLSASGRYLFFETAASNIPTNSTNTLNEVYRLDLQDSDRIVLASVAPTGRGPDTRSIERSVPNGDGSKVTYVATDANAPSVVVRNLSTGVLTPITAGPTPVRGDDIETQISADGHFLAVRRTSQAPTSLGRGVYWVNLDTFEAPLCTPGLPASFDGDHNTFNPLILFPDGRTVGFEIANTNRHTTEIHFWNKDKGLFGMDGFLPYIPIVSKEPGNSSHPVLSPDGTSIVFLSSATNVVNGVNDGLTHLYIRVLKTGETALISHDPSSSPIVEDNAIEVNFRPDGGQIAFSSAFTGYTTGDFNQSFDIYTFDPATGIIRLISTADPSLTATAANGAYSLLPNCISRNGRFVTFSSTGSDLVAGDSNDNWDIFLADLALGSLSMVSVPVTGTSQPNHLSNDTQISPNGRFILFHSTSTNLVVGPVPARNNLYLHDTSTHTTVLASPASPVDSAGGVPGNPSMSGDGRYVLYEIANVAIVFDSTLGTAIVLGSPNNIVVKPGTSRISFDGTLIIYSNGLGSYALEWQSTRPAVKLLPLNQIRAVPFALTDNGSSVGCLNAAAAGTVPPVFSLVDTRTAAVSNFTLTNLQSVNSWVMTPDAAHVAFAGPLRGNNSNPIQIILLEISTGRQTAISTNSTGAFGNANSKSPSISDDGRFVAFKSEASDLIAGDFNLTQDAFLHDSITGTIDLLSHTPSGSPATDRTFDPFLSGDGSTAVFLSSASDLLVGSFNGFPQLFAASITTSNPMVDTDGDGLGDGWEIRYFGNLAQGPNDDPDHDGATNLQEFIAQTDPTNPNSVLQLALMMESNGTTNLRWATVASVKYQIQSNDNLAVQNWQNVGVVQVGNGAEAILPIDSTSSSQFFRLSIVQ